MTRDEKMAYLHAIACKRLDAQTRLALHIALTTVEYAEDPRHSAAEARALLNELCERHGIKINT